MGLRRFSLGPFSLFSTEWLSLMKSPQDLTAGENFAKSLTARADPGMDSLEGSLPKECVRN